MAKYFSSVNNLIHIKENSTNKFITVGNNRENSILNLDNDNINANFRVIDNIWTPQISLNNIESTYDSEIINIGSGNTVIQLNPKVGIGTNNPLVSFDINTTDSIKIPKGDISQRPQNLTENDQGLIRYNTELNKFEGFGGDSWKSLGGVIDNNKDTYITAESNNEDNNELQFYTAGDERMVIKNDGKIGIGTSNPEGLLDIYESNERIFKVTNDNIEISRSIIPINSNVDIGDPEHQIRDMYVSDNSLWIGDTHKISQSDGKLKFRKRNTSSIPDVIRNLPAYQDASTGVILQAIIDFFNDQTLSVVSNITLKHWLEFYKSQKGADRDISIQEVFRDNADDYEEETAADAWLVSNTNNIYLGNDYTKIGIGTDNPNVSLDLSYKTDAIKLPKGNNSTRDSINANTIEDQGLIRYNTELKQFEGFGAGNAWGSLGGVIDIDQDTYITAETNNEDNDELQFYTTGDERMIIKSDGKIGLNVSEPSHQVHIKGNTRIEGDLIVNGTQHIIDTDTSTTEQIIVTNDGTGPALIVNQIGAQPIVDIQDDSNSILFIENGGNIGIKTTNPSVSFEINTTDSIKIPKGDIEQRPKNLTENDQGLIRYNTELYQFEGFGSGNAWGSLGGVIDIDQDTYITAESNNEDNDELQFYTTGDERMIIKSDGKIGIGISEPLEQLHITGNIKIIGNILNDNLDFRFANIENIQLKTLIQPNLVSAKAINIDTTITGGLDNSTDNLKIKHHGITNDHILNGTIDLTQKVISNLPIVNGGTGANTANNARTNLGLAIGTNVQAYSAKLQSIANLAASASKIPMFSGLTDVTLLDFVDDEEMLGDSATAIPSQRSVKKYVDSLAGFLNIIVYTLHGSNLNCNVELLPPDADATLTLNSDYSIAGAEGTEQFTTFVADVSEDIAVSLGVESDSVIVTEVTEGSLIVEFTLKPSKIDSNFNPSQAVIGLKQTLEDPSSSILTNSKFLSQAVIVVPPEVVAQALDPTKIFITLDNDKEKVVDIAKYFKGEFITYELLTNPHDNVNLNTTLQQITILGAFRDTSYDIKINATKGDTLKLLIFNITEPEPLPPTGKDAKKIVLSNNKKQINLRDKFKGSYLEIFEIEQNPYNNVTLIDNSNMIYEIEGSFRDTSYSIIFKVTQNAGDLLSAYWTLNVKELPLIPKKLLPNIDNLIITTGQIISYNLDFVFIGVGLVYGFITNPYSDNIYITNNILYITENQRGITYDIEIFGKNLSQTLIWKITLTEDLPPAPIVIGVEESNFITSDILSYDLTTLFTGLNITYDIEYYYNIGGSTYPPIDNFFIQNKPWARYHSKNWNKHLNRIVDTSGYNRPSVEVLSGNINSYATYISGDKNASLKIPMPNTDNWTVCFAVKYNGANKGTIISGDNTILGNWNGFRGFVQLGGEILTKIENIGSSDDWVILCVKTNGTAPNNIKLNGVSIGTEICEIPLDCLYVNRDLNSDWIFSDFVIWDYELDISQSTIISDIFIQHIAGTTNALNNDLQPVDMHSLYNNYNFDNNIVTISGNNRGTAYDIYVVAINAKNNAKWKLEITEGSGTRSENISLTTGLYEYNIKHLFSSNVYDTKLSVNNENFYSITDDILTFYPNYRNIEYGLIINSANEQYIFNIKEETGVAPRSFSDNNFHLIDNRVIEYIDVIGANAIVDNTVVIESTTVLYFPENMISSLLLIDNNKYYYINNIVLNGIYQIKCDLNDIKILDNTLNVKYSSLSNGIAIDTTVVNNLLTDVFNVTDASSNPKFVLKYTPYEKVTILNNFVNFVSTVDVNPEFDSGSASVISGSTYSYSSDNNFTANFTEQFDNCELLLIDNNKYYYNSNVSLDGNKQFTLSANNVELVGSTFNSGTDGEVIDLTNVNALITNVFGSDQIISGGGGSSNVSIPLTQEPVVNPVISAIPLTINNIDSKVLTFNGNNTKIFSFREDESPFSWQEAYDEAIANGNRMPTKTELLDYLVSQGNQPLYNENVWVYVSASNAINKDAIQVGNTSTNPLGQSHYDSFASETFFTERTATFQRFYCEVIEKTEYNVNFPMDTKCDILLVGDNKYALESGVILNGDYTFELGSTSKIIKNSSDIYTSGTTDLNTVTELLPISTFGSWNTHNQTAINAGGRLPTRAEIIALLNGDTTNNHLINPSVDPNTKDVWIPVSDYVGAIIEIGDYPHTPPFYKMSTPNGGETYSEGTTTAYGDTVDTVLNLDVQWAPKTNIYYTKTAISSDISGTATDYDSSGIVLKYYMVSSGGTTGTIDTTNMLVWYKFDDDLIDSSGNGNSLIASSVSAPTLTESGITGNALRFQNNIDTTTITNGLRDGTCKIPSIDLVDKEFSISFWIKLVNNFDTNHSGIFMLGYNEGLQTDGYIKLSCAYYESKNNIDFYYKNNLSDEGGNASTDLSIDTWYNIIITITNSHLKVYTNNILTSTESLAEGLPDVIYDTNYLGFYADSTYTNTKDDFIIDDFRIYDKALTAQEISDIYNDTEPLVGGSTNYTPIQRVFLKYTTIVKTIEPSIVDIVYLHPVNTTPILITNDEYYIEIKSTNIIYLPKTYANAEILIIGSTKYVKYENVSLNEFATITIDNDQTTISVNNNNYDLTSGTTIDTALTTELNTYNITEHNNITKVLIKYTTNATTKVTNVVFKDQEYLNVLDYATSLQITNNNITYNENDLKISSNVVNDFDNYFTETIQATNEYGTSSLDYNFIKLGYDGVIVPNLENVSKDIYILNTIANIDLREIAIGKKYELIFNPYYFENNIELIDTTLTLTTNMRGIYDLLISIDNKLYVLRIHEFINEVENSFYI